MAQGSRGGGTLLAGGESQLPRGRLAIRESKEVTRLHCLGLCQHQVARNCSASQSAVQEHELAALAR
jgi:hypothetical protein